MEKDIRVNQGNSELTRQANPATFKAGDIFMAEGVGGGPEAQAPRTAEESVAHFAKLRVKSDSNLSGAPDGGLPPGFDSWPLDLQRAFKEVQSEKPTTDIQRKDMFPRVIVDSRGVKYIETMETDPDKIEKLRQNIPQTERGKALTPDQEDVLSVLKSKNLPKRSEQGFLVSVKRLSGIEDPIDREKAKQKLLSRIEKRATELEVNRKTSEATPMERASDTQPNAEEVVTEDAPPEQAQPAATQDENLPPAPEKELTEKEKWEQLKDVAGSMIFSVNSELSESRRPEYHRRVLEILREGDPETGMVKISQLAEDLEQEALTKENIRELYDEQIRRLEVGQGQEAGVSGEEALARRVEQLRQAGLSDDQIREVLQGQARAERASGNLESIDQSIDKFLSLVSGIGDSEENNKAILTSLVEDPDFKAWMFIGESDSIGAKKDFLEGILNNPSLDASQKRERLHEAVKQIGLSFKSQMTEQREDAYNPVRSAQDLGRFIAETYGTDYWGVDGHHPIVDKEGNFHSENLILWVREQTSKMHVDNRSSEISPLGQVHVNTGFRDISLYEMVRINRQRYLKDEKTGAVLDDLADELFTEAWAFGQIRNYSLAYTQTMNIDKQLPEVINKIHATNDLTHSDTLRKLLSMPENFDKGDNEVGRALLFANDMFYNLSDWQILGEVISGRKDFAKDYESSQGDSTTFTEQDFMDAIRVIQGKNDWEEIDEFDGFYRRYTNEEIGKNIGGYLVTAEDVEKKKNLGGHIAKKEDIGKFIGGHLVTPEDVENGKGMFYCKDPGKGPDGKEIDLFRYGHFDIKTFSTIMNIYKYANYPENMTKLVRELIRQKAAERVGISSGIERDEDGKKRMQDKYEGIKQAQLALGRSEAEAEKEAKNKMEIDRTAKRVNIVFAENLAEQLQRPYGGAARNDTDRRGYDAQTKLSIEPYLIRQSAAGRAGPVGVREAVGIYRNVGFDMYTILKTETGFSPLELFTKIREIENDPSLSEEERAKLVKNETEKMRFALGAEKDAAGNIQSRGFQIFHAQTGGEHINLDEIVTWDPYQGVRIDVGKWEEKISDGFIKPARYLASTNGGMKFTSKMRYLDTLATGDKEANTDGAPVFQDLTVAESVYSPEVLREFVAYKKAGGGGKEKDLKPFKLKRVRTEEGSYEAMDFDTLDDEQKNFLDYGKGRLEMGKVAIALGLGAELAHHRNRWKTGAGNRWGYVRTEAFIEALQAMEEIAPDPNNPGRTIKTGKRFFDDELIKLIRKRGNAKTWRLATEDLVLEAGPSAASSIIEIFSRFVQSTLKD